MIAELRREVLELKERRDADDRVAEEAERGTAKGRTFEELVHAAIEEIAAGAGRRRPPHRRLGRTSPGARRATRWSRSAAALGSPLATIVFEAKNKRLSKNDAWTELNACMGERDAVVRGARRRRRGQGPVGARGADRVPGQQDHRRARPRGPGPARAAARLPLRARARRWPPDADELEVDAAGVRDAAEEAAARLKRANRVRKSLTSVTNSAEAARRRVRRDGRRRRALPGADRGPGRAAAAAEPSAGLGQQQLVLRALALGADLELGRRRRPSPSVTS